MRAASVVLSTPPCRPDARYTEGSAVIPNHFSANVRPSLAVSGADMDTTDGNERNSSSSFSAIGTTGTDNVSRVFRARRKRTAVKRSEFRLQLSPGPTTKGWSTEGICIFLGGSVDLRGANVV